MKFLFLLWITVRATFDASVWATAVWCLLYSFTSVSWMQCFSIFSAIHLIGNLSSMRYISIHTRQDCFSSMRLESMSVGLCILCAPIISILPTAAAIVLLNSLQVWTNLETHWLHTWLFVACVVYNLSRHCEKARMALHANSPPLQRHGSVWKRRTDPAAGIVAKDAVGKPYCEEWVGSRKPPGKVARSAQKTAYNSCSTRVIDV
jgi:hypothetical protein